MTSREGRLFPATQVRRTPHFRNQSCPTCCGLRRAAATGPTMNSAHIISLSFLKPKNSFLVLLNSFDPRILQLLGSWKSKIEVAQRTQRRGNCSIILTSPSTQRLAKSLQWGILRQNYWRNWVTMPRIGSYLCDTPFPSKFAALRR